MCERSLRDLITWPHIAGVSEPHPMRRAAYRPAIKNFVDRLRGEHIKIAMSS